MASPTSWIRVAVLAASLGLIACGKETDGGEATDTPNVVLIVVDTLRAPTHKTKALVRSHARASARASR